MEVFSPGEDIDVALFAAGCTYLLLGACVALWRGSRFASSGALVKGLLQHVVVPLRQARGKLQQGGEHKDMNSVVQQADGEFHRRKLEHTIKGLPLAQCIGMIIILALWFGGTVPTSFAQNFSSLAMATMVMVIWIAPSLVTARSADWLYSFMMAFSSVNMSPIAVPADAVLSYALGTWVVSLTISYLHLKPWLNAFWIAIINAMACLTLAVGQRSGGPCANSHTFRVAAQLSVISFVSVLCLIFVDWLLKQLTRLELEAQSSRSALAAAQSVLRSVCDVVVVVDDELRLEEDSAELRNMLLLNQTRQLQQEDLRGFLASAEDCAKFSEQVRNATSSGQNGGEPSHLSIAFHVSMKDSAGITLEVEVFVVQFLSRAGKDAYLVGIREQSDSFAPSELRRSQGGPGSFGREPRRCSSPHAPAPSFTSGAPWHQGDAASSSSSSSELLMEDKTSAWIDLLSDEWSIVDATDTFKMCMGLAEDELELLPLVRSDQRERLIDFAQTAHFDSTDHAAPAILHEPIFLRTAHMRRLKLCVCATLHLDWLRPPCPTQQAAEVLRISLEDIKCLRGKRWGKARRAETRDWPQLVAARREMSDCRAMRFP